MKKTISLFLALILVVLTVTPVSATETTSTFSGNSSWIDNAETFLANAVLPLENDYSLSDCVDIALGQEIPVYGVEDDGFIHCLEDAQFYPVVSGDKVIGLLQVYMCDSETAVAYQ